MFYRVCFVSPGGLGTESNAKRFRRGVLVTHCQRGPKGFSFHTKHGSVSGCRKQEFEIMIMSQISFHFHLVCVSGEQSATLPYRLSQSVLLCFKSSSSFSFSPALFFSLSFVPFVSLGLGKPYTLPWVSSLPPLPWAFSSTKVSGVKYTLAAAVDGVWILHLCLSPPFS